MNTAQRSYLPAAGRDWALPFYDTLARLLGADAARQALLGQVDLPPDGRVLDIGCGTGTLVTQIKQRCPNVDVVGLDPDPKALARARRKAERAGVAVRLDQGFSDALPYSDASFDRVLSSFMLHHLPDDEKVRTMREVRRVLKPGGVFHLLDFAPSQAHEGGFFARLIHSHDRLEGNEEDRVLSLMREAGLDAPQVVEHRTMHFGHVAYYRAGV